MAKTEMNTAPAIPSWATLDAKATAIRCALPNDTFAATVMSGAIQVARSDNPIRGNLCAAALRELAGHILHTLAPDPRVTKCSWFQQVPDTDGPTRRQRATYIFQAGLSTDFVRDDLALDQDNATRPLLKAMDGLHKATHVREETILWKRSEIRLLVGTVFDGVLALFDAARTCRHVMNDHLAAKISDAVLDTLIGETIAELDELSTHTTYGAHYIDQIAVSALDDEGITFKVDGTVDVVLQYGSNSDVRNDTGAVLSDDYPFTARVSAKTRTPTTLAIDPGALSVDTSSFYE